MTVSVCYSASFYFSWSLFKKVCLEGVCYTHCFVFFYESNLYWFEKQRERENKGERLFPLLRFMLQIAAMIGVDLGLESRKAIIICHICDRHPIA